MIVYINIITSVLDIVKYQWSTLVNRMRTSTGINQQNRVNIFRQMMVSDLQATDDYYPDNGNFNKNGGICFFSTDKLMRLSVIIIMTKMTFRRKMWQLEILMMYFFCTQVLFVDIRSKTSGKGNQRLTLYTFPGRGQHCFTTPHEWSGAVWLVRWSPNTDYGHLTAWQHFQ